MIPLPERIHQIITGHNGIRASRLCAQLSTEYLHLSNNDIRSTLMDMVRFHELYEIEYVLPSGRNESLILPFGSKLAGTSSLKKETK